MIKYFDNKDLFMGPIVIHGSHMLMTDVKKKQNKIH